MHSKSVLNGTYWAEEVPMAGIEKRTGQGQAK